MNKKNIAHRAGREQVGLFRFDSKFVFCAEAVNRGAILKRYDII